MNNKGFTLIELIISIAILMIITVPLTGMFIFSTKVSAYSRDELDGISAAKKYLEEIKASEALFTVDSEEGLEYKEFKLYVDILGVEEYSSSEINTGLDFTSDVEIMVLGQYNLKYSKDCINFNFLSTPDLDIEFTDKKDFYINGTEIIKNHKDDLNIGIYFDNINGIYNFKIKNFTNYNLNLYIVEPETKKYQYALDILEGRVNTYRNLKINQEIDIQPYMVYKININVEKNGKYITTLKGTKRFDY